MKTFIYPVILALFFITCKKDEKKHTVTYKVNVIAGHPSYSVQYSASDNSTKSEGPMTTEKWTSLPVTDREGGTSVFLTVNGGTGGTYKMYILIDGYLEGEGIMDDPYGPRTIEAKIED
jgi:hypothetical protein